jgi:C4-dicarboxylate transporter DctM subunit
MAYIYVGARRRGMVSSRRPSLREFGRAFVDALIPMGLPIIIFGGILGGVFTPTEAAAVAVLYAAIVGLFVYKEIPWSALPEILLQSAVITASVCFLLGTAAVVAWILTVGQVPAFLAKIMTELSAGPTAFLILTAILFILLGAVIEGPAAVVILLPTFLPLVKQFGIDLVHYSIVITAAVGIGLFLPPLA